MKTILAATLPLACIACCIVTCLCLVLVSLWWILF